MSEPTSVQGDLELAGVELLADLVVEQVLLDQRGAAEAVHEDQDLRAVGGRQVLEDRVDHHLDDLGGGHPLRPLAARLAVDADAQLDLVVADLKIGVPDDGVAQDVRATPNERAAF